ncbi:shikimate kinase [Paenibacillus thalictri]|uniref:Shikimate kinase n=1 Tax=Paenibacillus thalictri TaxID=2527873 RepID=A0A4Q9DPL3_9BACL|nr:shikimate kinase [Paenibacillus thalictri]TBL78263.1 shikimate kinase [Paenibacillus thalictri]
MIRLSKNIVLVGMAGTGKTTVGQALAARLGWDLIDTDHLVEREQGMPIRQIFAERGEAAFRTIETEAVVRTMARSGLVVSTGGGAVLAETNRQALKQGGLVIALKAPVEVIIERVRSDKDRPLFQGNFEEQVRKLAEQRKQAYDFADMTIDTTLFSVEQVVDEIVSRL